MRSRRTSGLTIIKTVYANVILAVRCFHQRECGLRWWQIRILRVPWFNLYDLWKNRFWPPGSRSGHRLLETRWPDGHRLQNPYFAHWVYLSTFLDGNFLSHVVNFRNFMAGNFLGWNFLGGYPNVLFSIDYLHDRNNYYQVHRKRMGMHKASING